MAYFNRWAMRASLQTLLWFSVSFHRRGWINSRRRFGVDILSVCAFFKDAENGFTMSCVTVTVRNCIKNCVNTSMFQANHHSPCDQESEGNLPKWLLPRSTLVGSHEVLWKAGHGSHQNHHPGITRPTERCLRKAPKILKDSSHPTHRLLSLLPHRKRYLKAPT